MPYRAAKISFDGSHYIATPKENFPQGHKRRRATRPLSVEEVKKKEQFEAVYKESQKLPRKERKAYMRNERGKFMTVTGDAFGESRKDLLNLDSLPVKDLLLKRFSKHKTYSGAGKGIEGLSSMSDRDVIERASAARHGDTFKALYDGKDLQNNHSNSDMALMTRLAFWCNGDKDQMLRIFATSGLYRPDKSPEYYEHTALKAVRENSNRYEPKRTNKPSKPPAAKSSSGNSK